MYNYSEFEAMNGCCEWMLFVDAWYEEERRRYEAGKKALVFVCSPCLCLPGLLALAGIDMRSALSLGL